MVGNKTKPTTVDIEEFLATVSETRRAEAQTLVKLMQQISGEQPVMWGPSIIGFGTQHYKSEAGREGDMGILAFSPRKAALTIYFYEGFDRYGEELAKLGKHKISQGCLYINKLDDIDLSTLEAMLRSSYDIATQPKETHNSVEQYIANIPVAARSKFDELRSIVQMTFPEAKEVMSYGIVSYKIDIKKRGYVFISGWKDHVGMYPVPKDDVLRNKLEPYIKGKGTLWFNLRDPLPSELIKKAVRGLMP